ncbi:MAG: hypothetical protein K6G63_00870 [Eubacterium sp.]|nr:hypothetical protein [Eubacterium sp.]
MEKKQYKKAFSTVKLSGDEKNEIWNAISSQIDDSERVSTDSSINPPIVEKKERSTKMMRSLVKVAGVLVVMGGVLAGVNAASNGALVSAISSFWNASDSSRTVIQQTTDYHAQIDTVYAPEVIDYNGDRLIYASEFGLVVYDMNRKQIVGTVDLEAIGCNVLNAEKEHTRFYVKDERLTIFNENKGQASGRYHQFDLEDCKNVGNKTVVELKECLNGDADKVIMGEWKKSCKRAHIATFDIFGDVEDVTDFGTYSEFCARYGKNKYATIIMKTDDKSFDKILYVRDVKTGKTDKIAIKDSLSGDATAVPVVKLPKYTYNGDDMVEKALVECFDEDRVKFEGAEYKNEKNKLAKMHENEKYDVAMPLIYIKMVKKSKDYVKAYGLFSWQGLSLSGKTLYGTDSSGGGMAVAYLKEEGKGYKVDKILYPRDGKDYESDLEEMFGDDIEYDGYVWQKAEKRTIPAYVKDNNLDITKYKMFGFDAVKIK